LAVFIKKQKYPLKIAGLCSIIFTICEDINCLVSMDQKQGGFVLAQTAFCSVFLRKIPCYNEFFLPRYRKIHGNGGMTS